MPKSHLEDGALDYWSAVHLSVGAIMGVAVPNRRVAYPLMIAFELLEKRFWPGWSESTANVMADMAIDILGYEAGRRAAHGRG